MSLGREEAREILEEVLSRDEFDYRPKQTVRLEWLEKIFRDITRLLERIGEALSGLLDRLVQFIAGHLPAGKGGNGILTPEAIRVLVIVLAGLAVAALIFLTVFIVVKTVRRNERMPRGAETDFARELESFANDAEAPYRLALEKKAEKDFRGAFRYLFISLLVRFRMCGIVEIRKSGTNRHYLAEIRRNAPAVYGMAGAFFDTFNLCWYGRRALSEEELAAWFDRYEETVRAAERGPEAGAAGGVGRNGSPEKPGGKKKRRRNAHA